MKKSFTELSNTMAENSCFEEIEEVRKYLDNVTNQVLQKYSINVTSTHRNANIFHQIYLINVHLHPTVPNIFDDLINLTTM